MNDTKRIAFIRLGPCEFPLDLVKSRLGAPIEFVCKTITHMYNRHIDNIGPYVKAEIVVVHTYECAATKLGKKFGPCNCGGDELMKRVVQLTETE